MSMARQKSNNYGKKWVAIMVDILLVEDYAELNGLMETFLKREDSEKQQYADYFPKRQG